MKKNRLSFFVFILSFFVTTVFSMDFQGKSFLLDEFQELLKTYEDDTCVDNNDLIRALDVDEFKQLTTCVYTENLISQIKEELNCFDNSLNLFFNNKKRMNNLIQNIDQLAGIFENYDFDGKINNEIALNLRKLRTDLVLALRELEHGPNYVKPVCYKMDKEGTFFGKGVDKNLITENVDLKNALETAITNIFTKNDILTYRSGLVEYKLNFPVTSYASFFLMPNEKIGVVIRAKTRFFLLEIDIANNVTEYKGELERPVYDILCNIYSFNNNSIMTANKEHGRFYLIAWDYKTLKLLPGDYLLPEEYYLKFGIQTIKF